MTSFKNLRDLEDDIYGYDSDYSLEDGPTPEEQQQIDDFLMYSSMEELTGREAIPAAVRKWGLSSTAARHPPLSGYDGLVQWFELHGKRGSFTRAAYDKAQHNKHYNRTHGTSMTTDPRRVVLFLAPQTHGMKYPLVRALVEEGASYVEWNLNTGAPMYVGTQKYSSYVASRKLDRETTHAMHLSKQRARKQARENRKLQRSSARVEVIGTHVVASDLNGAQGEATNTDDLEHEVYTIAVAPTLHGAARVGSFAIYNGEYCPYKKPRGRGAMGIRVKGGKWLTRVREAGALIVGAELDEHKPYQCTIKELPDGVDEVPTAMMRQLCEITAVQKRGEQRPQNFSVISAVWAEMKVTFLSSTVTNNLPLAMRSHVQKLLGGKLPAAVIDYHIAVMMATLEARDSFPKVGVQTPLDMTTIALIDSVMSFNASFRQKSGVELPLPAYESLTANFVFAGRGYEWKDCDELAGGQHPCFKTRRRPETQVAWYLTELCRLEGDAPFELPDNTPKNVTGSLKRVLGARGTVEEDGVLRSNQDRECRNQLALAADHFPGKLEVVDMGGILPSKFITPGNRDPIEVGYNLVAEALTDRVLDDLAAPTLVDNYSRVLLHQYEASWSGWGYRHATALGQAIFDGLEWVTDNIAMICASLRLPHPKRNERLQFLGYLCRKNLFLAATPPNPDAAFKFELAKPGKPGRLFVKYKRVIAYTGYLAECVKKLTACCCDFRWRKGVHLDEVTHPVEPYAVQSRVQVCLDVSIGAVTAAYNGMMAELSSAPSGSTVSLVFSDDTLMGINTPTGIKLANVDISSNDTGMDLGMFALYHNIFSKYNRAISKWGVAPLMKPLKITNPYNPEQYMTMEPKTIFMGSGCAQTTGINNMGNSLGNLYAMKRIAEAVHDGVFSCQRLAEYVSRGFADIGHKITYEPCLDETKCQFLKRSPMRTKSGKVVMCLNLGAILRSFGSLEKDLTPTVLGIKQKQFDQMSWSERSQMFLSSVIAGYSPEPRNPVLDILRKNFSTKPTTKAIATGFLQRMASPLFHIVCPEWADYSQEEVMVEDILSRYDIPLYEWENFISQLQEFQIATVFRHRVLTRIYHVDYSTPLAGPLLSDRILDDAVELG